MKVPGHHTMSNVHSEMKARTPAAPTPRDSIRRTDTFKPSPKPLEIASQIGISSALK